MAHRLLNVLGSAITHECVVARGFPFVVVVFETVGELEAVTVVVKQ